MASNNAMKFISGLLVATIVASSSFAGSSSNDPEYIAFGMGLTKCTEANENFEKKEFQFVLKVWLAGYMIAMNSVLKELPVGLRKHDIEESIEAIRSYCTSSSNRTDFLAQATEEYWRQRVRDMSESIEQ